MSTWAASVYTVHVIMFPRASASVYIVTILLSLFPRTSRVHPAGISLRFELELEILYGIYTTQYNRHRTYVNNECQDASNN